MILKQKDNLYRSAITEKIHNRVLECQHQKYLVWHIASEMGALSDSGNRVAIFLNYSSNNLLQTLLFFMNCLISKRKLSFGFIIHFNP